MGGSFSYFRSLLGSREMCIMIAGLDWAGKTTILYRLQSGEMNTTVIPTIRFNVEQIRYKGLKHRILDFTRQPRARPFWRLYYSKTDAIVFVIVVDSADRDRIDSAKDELFYMLREDELSTAVLVVLANKQDIQGCLSSAEVNKELGLDEFKNRTFQIFETSALTGDGLDEAMNWLSKKLRSRKLQIKHPL